jgi:hypothetical protein
MTARPYDPAIAPRGDKPVAGYHALSALAVCSLALGALSVLAFVNRSLAVIPLTAIVLGLVALRRIRRAPQELTGAREALGGIALAAVFWIAGYGWLIIDEIREVPAGYEGISYETLQPDKDKPNEWIPQKAEEMAADKRRVFIQGYMMPTRQLIGLKHFTLCPTNGFCRYCNPAPTRTEMIRVTLEGDLTAEYTTRLIGIGGIFGLDVKNPSGVPYSMTVDYLK